MIEHYKNLSLENIVEEIDGIIYTEQWKPINGYEKNYHISSFGRIKSLATNNIFTWTSGRKYKSKKKEKIC